MYKLSSFNSAVIVLPQVNVTVIWEFMNKGEVVDNDQTVIHWK